MRTRAGFALACGLVSGVGSTLLGLATGNPNWATNFPCGFMSGYVAGYAWAWASGYR